MTMAVARRWAAGVVALSAIVFSPGGPRAQEMSADVTDRCMRASVKIVVTIDREHGSVGSGSVIDPRGYVLTNFHVVGAVRPGDTPIGRLFAENNEVVLGMVTAARETARPRYVGRVVRVDPQLDLALIRIVSDTDGNPVGAQAFPFVPMAGTQRLRPGSRVFAFGYPLSLRTINVTGGAVTGFQMNARQEVAWLRTDARFNRGNSGGMLVDSEGNLVAVPTAVVSGRAGEALLEPIELARPVERIPRQWMEELRACEEIAVGAACRRFRALSTGAGTEVSP